MPSTGRVVPILSALALVAAMALLTYFQVATPNAGPLTDFIMALFPDPRAPPTVSSALLISFSEANVLVISVALTGLLALFCLVRALYSGDSWHNSQRRAVAVIFSLLTLLCLGVQAPFAAAAFRMAYL